MVCYISQIGVCTSYIEKRHWHISNAVLLFTVMCSCLVFIDSAWCAYITHMAELQVVQLVKATQVEEVADKHCQGAHQLHM